MHDIGKCSPSYQRYIRTPGANRGPDHSTAGARAAAAEYGIVGRLMAFAIAGHHSGLPNGSSRQGKGRTLNERLDRDQYDIPEYDDWFKDLAREVDANEDEARWEDRLTKVAAHKPKDDKPKAD